MPFRSSSYNCDKGSLLSGYKWNRKNNGTTRQIETGGPHVGEGGRNPGREEVQLLVKYWSNGFGPHLGPCGG